MADRCGSLAFQTSPDYVRAVWPAARGARQMRMHLDFEVVGLPAEGCAQARPGVFNLPGGVGNMVAEAVAMDATVREARPHEGPSGMPHQTIGTDHLTGPHNTLGAAKPDWFAGSARPEGRGR